jgi:hypothetical protein
MFKHISSFHAVVVAALALGALIALRSSDLWSDAQSDFWWQAVTGHQILQTGQWPTSDTYSFTVHGNEWIAYEWLAGVLFAVAEILGGFHGWMVLRFLLCAGMILLLFHYAHLRSGNLKTALLATLIMFPVVREAGFALRPQLIGYLFLLATLIYLERFRRGDSKNLWGLPLLMLVWVNTHGTFLIGLFVVGWFWVSGFARIRLWRFVSDPWPPHQRRHLGFVLLLCFAVLPLTPYGTRLAAYPLELILFQKASVAFLPEWQPPTVSWGAAGLFLLAVLLSPLISIFVVPASSLFDAGLVLLGTYGTMQHRRLSLALLIFGVSLLSMALSTRISDYKIEARPLLNAGIVAAVMVGLTLLFPSQQWHERVLQNSLPVRAAAYLRRSQSQRRVFNDFGWGGFLIWKYGPEGYKVFMDSRADVYEYAGVLNDYIGITSLDRVDLRLRKYRIDACLVKRGTALEGFLRSQSEWQLVYQDEVSVVYVRR